MTGRAALQIENPELAALKRRIFCEQLDDVFRVCALLQLAEDEHLIRVRIVDRGLARRDPLAGHDHRLHPLQKVVALVDTRRRRDDDAAGRAIDGNHGPGRKRGGGQREQRRHDESCFPHRPFIPFLPFRLRPETTPRRSRGKAGVRRLWSAALS